MEIGKKVSRIWIVNVVSFFLFSLLGVTGLLNWLIVPWGRVQGAGFSVSLRHFLVTIHEWTALLFMITIGVHVSLHWSYIKNMLESSKKSK